MEGVVCGRRRPLSVTSSSGRLDKLLHEAERHVLIHSATSGRQMHKGAPNFATYTTPYNTQSHTHTHTHTHNHTHTRARTRASHFGSTIIMSHFWNVHIVTTIRFTGDCMKGLPSCFPWNYVPVEKKISNKVDC